MRQQDTLHVAMKKVLDMQPNKEMLLTDLTKKIAELDLYRKRDNTHPEGRQICDRARIHDDWFDIIIRLK